LAPFVVGGDKVFVVSQAKMAQLKIPRWYFMCLLSAGELQNKGVVQIHHGMANKHYREILHPKPQDEIEDDNAPAVKRRRAAQRHAIPDADVEGGDDDADDDEGDGSSSSDGDGKSSTSDSSSSSSSSSDDSSGPSGPLVPMHPGLGDGDDGGVGPGPPVPIPGLGDGGGGGVGPGRVRRQWKWGIFGFTPKFQKGVHISWQATCPLHRNADDVASTGCKKTMAFGRVISEDDCIVFLKLWCLEGRGIGPALADCRSVHLDIVPRSVAMIPAEEIELQRMDVMPL
jgi:hypothetical protein